MFSLTFYLSLVLYTGVAIPLLALIVATQAPFIPHQATMRRFRRMITWYGYGIIKGLARPAVRVIYETPTPDPDRAKIFVANHIAASDPFLMAVLPEAVVQVVNRWPFKLPVWGLFARWAGYLDIRGMTADAFQEKAARLLSAGISMECWATLRAPLTKSWRVKLSRSQTAAMWVHSPAVSAAAALAV